MGPFLPKEDLIDAWGGGVQRTAPKVSRLQPGPRGLPELRLSLGGEETGLSLVCLCRRKAGKRFFFFFSRVVGHIRMCLRVPDACDMLQV